MTLFEVDAAATRIREEVDPEANIIFGSTFDPGMKGRVRISVVATGITPERPMAGAPRPAGRAAELGRPGPSAGRNPFAPRRVAEAGDPALHLRTVRSAEDAPGTAAGAGAPARRGGTDLLWLVKGLAFPAGDRAAGGRRPSPEPEDAAGLVPEGAAPEELGDIPALLRRRREPA